MRVMCAIAMWLVVFFYLRGKAHLSMPKGRFGDSFLRGLLYFKITKREPAEKIPGYKMSSGASIKG